MKISFKKISKKSLKNIWHHPIVWLFGIFSSLFITNRLGLVLLNIEKVTNWIKGLITLQVIQNNFQIPLNVIINLLSNSFYSLLILFLIVIVYLYIAILSQICIVKYFSKIKKPFNKKLKLGNLIKNNHKSVWKIFLIYILSIIALGFILYLFKLTFKFTLLIPILYYIIFFIIISLLLGFIARFIIFSIIIEKKKIISSIKYGWKMFWKNFFQIIKFSIILFFITFLFGILLIIISATIAVPFIVIVSLLFKFKPDIGFHILTIIWPIFQTIITTLFIAIFSAFQYNVWVEFYHKIRSNKKVL